MTKIEQVQALLRTNENDTLNIERRYKTVTARMHAMQELRIEKGLLEHELGRLNGQPVKVEQAATTSEFPHNSEDGPPREPVHA